jgi:hypothetical protein
LSSGSLLPTVYKCQGESIHRWRRTAGTDSSCVNGWNFNPCMYVYMRSICYKRCSCFLLLQTELWFSALNTCSQ